jgi:hypothetical protein
MCEPTTILAIGTAVAVAATVGGTVMQMQQAEDNAEAAEQAARYDEDRSRDRARRLLAAQRVGYAKGGVLLAGTPADVQADTAAEAELDALAIRYGGASRAGAFRAQGREALIGGIGAAGGALLTGYTAMSPYNQATASAGAGPAYAMPGFRPPGIR